MKIPFLEQLMSYEQFVVFKQAKIPEQNKPAKIPFDPKSDTPASVSDPTTWASLDVALNRLENNKKKYAGLGFVLTETDPFCFVDIDHCHDKKTSTNSIFAIHTIRRLNSYTELSPSQTGLHILVRASLPPGRRRTARIEIYDQKRFFTITGWCLPGSPLKIHERQDELTRLYEEFFGKPDDLHHVSTHHNRNIDSSDAELISQIQCSHQGMKFSRLFSGNITGYPSQSEADLALCAILAFWTQNPIQIDRIFRLSGLYREKWDSKRGLLTYGEITIKCGLGNRK